MAKNAIIVESPAKIRTLERFVGPGYKILASMGHVRDLPERELGVDVNADFAPQYEIIPRARQVISKLRSALKDVDTIYLASDPDREGEAIGWHLAQVLKAKDVKRIRFNEITASAVLDALAHPTDLDLKLVDAQQARRVLDRLVGYLISPVLWERIKSSGRTGALSAGRVQSVALRMICDREREIAAFVPVEHWSVEATLSPVDRDAQFVAELQTRDGAKLELHTEAETTDVVAELQRAPYLIRDITRQTRKRNAPPPFITSTLQQQAARELHFSAKKTMMVAQQLYEGVELPEGVTALITYMRTDSTRLAESARSEGLAYIKEQYGPEYMGAGGPRAAKKGVQDAHEAIRPTHVELTATAVKEYLNKDQLRLYELIWRRFVASLMAPAVFNITTVDVEAGRYGLRASGSVPVFAGYRAVYEEARPEEEEEKREGELPELSVGEALRLLGLNPEQHFTKPPPRFTEASLVRALEENGIGRPSTYAPIIETLRQRRYVTMQQRAFVPTPLGLVVSDYLVEHFPQVMDIQFTAHVETDLDTVESGEKDWVDLVREFYQPLTGWIEEARQARPKLLGETCPECGGEVVERISASGRFAGCRNYPRCKFTRNLDLGVPKAEVPDLEDQVCPQCGKPLSVRQGPTGPFIGCAGYPGCRYTRPVNGEEERPRLSIPTDVPCDECGQPMTVRSGRRGPFLGCSGYPQCKFTRNLTAEEVEKFAVEGADTAPSPAGDPTEPPPDANCPECGGKMVARRSRRGPFLGCASYPKCRGTLPLDGAAAGTVRPEPEPAGRNCPECGKPLVVRDGRRGKFLGCTGYPKCRYTADVSS